MRAIETYYRGCRFRSRLEARYAVFFDYLGVRWEYEPQGWRLGPKGREELYLPDFWLPGLALWVEVKPLLFDDDGEAANPRDERLCELLAEGSGTPVALACGVPDAVTVVKPWVPDPSGLLVQEGVAYHGITPGSLKVYCDALDRFQRTSGWRDNCFWATSDKGYVCVCPDFSASCRQYLRPNGMSAIGVMPPDRVAGPVPREAVEAARSARFEHGESGPSRRLPVRRPFDF